MTADSRVLLPAAFLDRDGVINRDSGYVGRVEDFTLLPGVRAACRRLAAAGYRLVIVTNQGGIALGYYREDDYHAVMRHMTARFAAAGVQFAGLYYCPYHPRRPALYPARRGWRKPLPGMLTAAARALRLDVAASVMVGDKLTDMQAAEAAGVPRRYFIGGAGAGAISCRSLPHAVWDILKHDKIRV